MHIEEKLQLAFKVIDSSFDAVMITDSNTIIRYVNPAFSTMTGYSADEVVGKKPDILKSGRHDGAFYKEIWESLIKTGRWKGEIWNRRKSGEVYPQRMTINTIKNSNGCTTHYAGMFYDISETKQTEEEMIQKANYDSLTGLANRQLFLDRLAQGINRSKRAEKMLAILFIDLDNFKNVNDSLGHDAGDALLKEVAVRLKTCARDVDTFARLGGDEFTIILEPVQDQHDAVIVAKRVLKVLSTPVMYKGEELYVSVSIGIAVFPENGETASELLKNADLAMYHVKQLGKNNYHFFTKSLDEQAVKRMQLEIRLRKTINNNEMIAYYQPKIDMESGLIVGMEALARWIQEDGTIISPVDFIPVAEATGLIETMDRLILQKACTFLNKVHGAEFYDPKRPIAVSVNLSVKNLENLGLVESIKKAIEHHGIDPQFIELEVTESMIVRNLDSAIKILMDLSKDGFKLAIDDFGTGYSSLSYLTKFPLSTLKIDKSFVSEISENKNAQAVAKAIIYMGHGMGMKIIAEGVETKAQLDYLRTIDCDQIQGYYFSRPLPENEMMEMLRSGVTFKQ